MSLRDIDESLKNWNTRLAAAAQNVMDLQAHPTYRRLAMLDGSLRGKTASEASIAVNTVARLLECYELLRHTIARAEEMRRNVPMISLKTDQREAEIKAVLDGKSVQMPAVQIPLEKRGLLGSIEQVDRMTPAGLLDVMSKAFEEAKAKVLAIDGAFEALGRGFEDEEKRLKVLQNDGFYLSVPERARLQQAADQIEAIKAQAAADPLSTNELMSRQVTGLLSELANVIVQRKQRRSQAESDLRRAESTLTNAREAAHASGETHAEACAKIAGFSQTAPSQSREIEGLADWLERLRRKSDEGAWDAVAVGIKNWAMAAQNTITVLGAATSKAKNALELRAELRGRIDAFRAKARAFHVAEEDELVTLAQQAKDLLDAKPCSLEAAEKVVGQYEAALTAKLNSNAAKNVKG